jgi:hypothetical protein
VSPKIGILIDTRKYAAASLRPLDRARMAVNVVESQGMRVALDLDDHGVRSVIGGGWVAASRYSPRRVSVLGAICIVFQPSLRTPLTTIASDLEPAAATALDVAPVWLAGMRDGLDGQADAGPLGDLRRALYLDGLRAGHLLFAELTVECSECGGRRYHREQRCSACR